MGEVPGNLSIEKAWKNNEILQEDFDIVKIQQKILQLEVQHGLKIQINGIESLPWKALNINNTKTVIDSESKGSWKVVWYENIDPKNALEALNNISKTLSIYPNWFLQKYGLKKISIVKKIHALHIASQEKSDTAQAMHRWWFIDLVANHDMASNFHHEIFHLLDASIDGDDKIWMQLMDKHSLQYHGQKWYMKLDPNNFVSQYATSKISDDQAETYETMITNTEIVGWEPNETIWNTQKPVLIEKRKSLLQACKTIWLDEAFWWQIRIQHLVAEYRSKITQYLKK